MSTGVDILDPAGTRRVLMHASNPDRMGLDVCVTSLMRYYAHDWETVVQQACRQAGMSVHLVRANSKPEDALQDPDDIRSVVLAWRAGPSRSPWEAGFTESDLDWDESPGAPYVTDRPAWDCFGAFLLLAMYEEEPRPLFGSRWPKKLDQN